MWGEVGCISCNPGVAQIVRLTCVGRERPALRESRVSGVPRIATHRGTSRNEHKEYQSATCDALFCLRRPGPQAPTRPATDELVNGPRRRRFRFRRAGETQPDMRSGTVRTSAEC